jgi:hypothetical protein
MSFLIKKQVQVLNKLIDQLINPILEFINIFAGKVDKKSLAHQIAKELNDEQSINYYYMLADHVHHKHLIRALQDTNRIARQKYSNKIFNRAAYFVGILRNRGIQTRFRAR